MNVACDISVRLLSGEIAARTDDSLAWLGFVGQWIIGLAGSAH